MIVCNEHLVVLSLISLFTVYAIYKSTVNKGRGGSENGKK